MKKKLICALLAGCMTISPATMSFAAETELATEAASEAVTEATSEAASEAVTETTSEAASETGKKTEYPLTISNFNYEKEPVEETFEKAPERVITFWSNSLESMLALGLGDRVISAVGMDENSILPELKDEFDKMIAGKEFNDFTDSNAAMSK